ncbi:RNA polymerase sigma factor [Bradyrhizobium sp. F1.13.3]|uniref:RNA polymerase sigma factor n=1 Tax=Bradyrhizobium sp. F1.13.3 TaxID=3156351 RepID=UPI0033959847
MKHIPPDTLCRVATHVPTASAFRKDLLKCAPALRRYARKLGGADLADDLLQATLERALTREAIYTAQGAMAAWLRQIMRNIACDQHEKRQRYDLFCDLAADAADDDSTEAEDYDSTVPDESTYGEREKQLDAKNFIELAAKVIGPEIWRCLELTGAGFSSEEIAAELGISAAGVRQNVSRGRRAMGALRAAPKHNVCKSIRKKSR